MSILVPPIGWKSGGFQTDPFENYVIMHLNMEDPGDGYSLVDHSGNGNAFSRSGNAHLSNSQKRFGERSASFDGTGDYYYSGNKSLYNCGGSATNFTVEFWAYATAAQSAGFMVSHATTWNWSEPSVLIWWDSDGHKVRFYSGGPERIGSPKKIPLSEWFHVSYGKIGSIWFLYLNGELCGNWNSGSVGNTWSATIGTCGWQRNATSTEKFTGYLDELRWWKGVSIRDGVNNFTPPTAPWRPLV